MKWLDLNFRPGPNSIRTKRYTKLRFEPLEDRNLLAAILPSIIRDINTGSSSPSQLTPAGDFVFFTATQTGSGQELWRTDGTCAGTYLVRDIVPGSNGSYIQDLTNINGVAFFTVIENPTIGAQSLWKSDGTSLGTTLVSSSYVNSASQLTNSGGKLYFTVNGSIWSSDGTSSGTTLFRYPNPSGQATSMLDVNGYLYFEQAQVGAGSATHLWKSDGTTAGTNVVTTAVGNIGTPTNVNGTLFFEGSASLGGSALWKSDGTSTGTALVSDIGFASLLTNVNGTLFFIANDGTHGVELWKSDGSSSGTVLVKDIRPGASSAGLGYLTSVDGTLYFRANDGSTGYELWKSDGTSSGTMIVKDIGPLSSNAYLANLTNLNGTLYFSADDRQSGKELWTTDGTSAGTLLVQDIAPGSGGSDPVNFLASKNRLYFSARDSSHGRELWGLTGPVIPRTVSLVMAGPTLAEAGDQRTIIASLNGVTDTTVDVRLDFTGTATFGVDYTCSSQVISIPAGQRTAFVTLTTINDLTYEGDESISIDITTVTGAVENGQQRVTTSIVDDDPLPTVDLAVGTSSIAENNGTTTVTARLTNPTTQQVTVDLAFSGTALIGADYTRSATVFIFAPGQTAASLSLRALNDATFESNEQIVVDIASITNGVENGVQQVMTTIVEDDSQPTVTLRMPATPVSESGAVIPVVATLSNLSWQDVAIELLYGGTATPGVDYNGNVAQIIIPAGQISAGITLTTIDDGALDGSESVLVSVSNVTNGSPNGVQTASTTIIDNQAPNVTLSLVGNSFAENGGVAVVRATLDKTASQAILIDLAFSGLGQLGTDYSANLAKITVPAGALTGTITLTGIDDTIPEGPESVIIDISNVTLGNELGTQQVTATILDDATDSLQLSGNTLTITGTPGADAITIDYSGSTTLFRATVNGVSTQYSASTVVVDTAGGMDTLNVTLSSLADTAALNGLAGSVTSSNYTINFSNVETTNLFGDVADRATFNDPGTVNTFTLLAAFSIMKSTVAGYTNETVGFGGNTGNGADNNDSLFIYGDSGNQTLLASPTQVSMIVGTQSLVGNNIRNSYAYGTLSGSAGTDTVTYSGTSTAEVLTSTPAYSVLNSTQTLQYFVGFKNVTANSGGGVDSAILYDSAGNDTFNSSTTTANFTGMTFNYTANGYSKVYAYQTKGNDTATLTGTSGIDKFAGNAAYVIMTSGVFTQQALNFSTVIVNAGAGADTATLDDSTGNDTINASGGLAELIYASGHKVQLNGFDTVTARGTNGGVNRKNVAGTLAYVLRFNGTWV